MAKKVATKHRDRVRNTVTRETGTLVDAYDGSSGGQRYGVLPDRGPKMSVAWEKRDVERIGGPSKNCTRCGSKDHHAFTCPVQDTSER